MLNLNGRLISNVDRRDDLLKLEIVIRQTHDLFLEMAALVDQQEDLVSSIWQNIGSGVDDIKEGRTQLNDAVWYKTSARKKKIILVAILTALLIIIILVLVWEFSG